VSDTDGDDPYEVLGVARKATQEQIEKAYGFLKDMYGDAALATYTLLDPEEMRAARARVNRAFEVLGDPQRRREYDAALEAPARGPAVLAFVAAAAGGAPNAPPPDEDVVLPEPVAGAALRRFREERGVSLRDISTRSKVGVRFLEYIEADRHELLPARVYLRSFLIEYAKALGLDPRHTSDAYIARMPKTDS
jgi:flagellar biosynthesis protein FlhG